MAVDIDFKKKVQTINFFTKHVSSKTISKIDLLKTVFFADRYHLLKYGRTVTGDTYYAMKHGPVASVIKNICNLDENYLSKEEISYINQYLKINKNSVHSLSKEYDSEVFSESDLEALNKAVRLFIRLKNEKIDVAEYSHRFFDWDNKYAPFLPIEENNRIDLDLDEFFNVVKDDYCAEIPENIRDLNRELINYC